MERYVSLTRVRRNSIGDFTYQGREISLESCRTETQPHAENQQQNQCPEDGSYNFLDALRLSWPVDHPQGRPSSAAAMPEGPPRMFYFKRRCRKKQTATKEAKKNISDNGRCRKRYKRYEVKKQGYVRNNQTDKDNELISLRHPVAKSISPRPQSTERIAGRFLEHEMPAPLQQTTFRSK